jgi:acyl carrier protein
MEKLDKKIKDFVVENFLFGDEEGLNGQTSFMENAIIDSTGILELVDFLENDFNIEISDDELLPENLDSIDNVVNFLEMKMAIAKAS